MLGLACHRHIFMFAERKVAHGVVFASPWSTLQKARIQVRNSALQITSGGKLLDEVCANIGGGQMRLYLLVSQCANPSVGGGGASFSRA